MYKCTIALSPTCPLSLVARGPLFRNVCYRTYHPDRFTRLLAPAGSRSILRWKRVVPHLPIAQRAHVARFAPRRDSKAMKNASRHSFTLVTGGAFCIIISLGLQQVVVLPRICTHVRKSVLKKQCGCAQYCATCLHR